MKREYEIRNLSILFSLSLSLSLSQYIYIYIRLYYRCNIHSKQQLKTFSSLQLHILPPQTLPKITIQQEEQIILIIFVVSFLFLPSLPFFLLVLFLVLFLFFHLWREKMRYFKEEFEKKKKKEKGKKEKRIRKKKEK